MNKSGGGGRLIGCETVMGRGAVRDDSTQPEEEEMSRLAIRNRNRAGTGIDPRTAGPPNWRESDESNDEGATSRDATVSGASEAVRSDAGDDGNEESPRGLFGRERRKRRTVAGLVGGVLIAACGAVGWTFAGTTPQPSDSESSAGKSAERASASEPNGEDRPSERQDRGEAAERHGPERTYSAREHEKFAALARGRADDEPDGESPGRSKTPPAAHIKPRPSARRAPRGDLLDEARTAAEEAEGGAVGAALAGARSPDELSGGDRQLQREETKANGEQSAAVESSEQEGGERPARASESESQGVGRAREADVRAPGVRSNRRRGLTDTQIRNGMRRISKSVAACRQRHQRRGAPLDVRKVRMTVEVQSDGRVSSFRVRPAPVRESVFGKCLRIRQPQWSFPKFVGGPVTIENRTFVLQ